MKFLCDRCNTRYSIGDERVRGKILKIRCKHCSNVITVREGMGLTDNSVVGPLPEGQPRPKKATIAPDALDERAVSGLLKMPARTDAPATRPLRPTGTSTSPSPGLASAVAAAAAAAAPVVAPPRPPEPPPPALDEEWYVSIDGVQSGPFSLAEAQHWVAQKSIEADLHCWSEGFDDWLPVDKVSHFRGLRQRPSAPSAPPAPPRPRPGPPAAPMSSSAGPLSSAASLSSASSLSSAASRSSASFPSSASSSSSASSPSLSSASSPSLSSRPTPSPHASPSAAGFPLPAPSSSRLNASPPFGTPATNGEPPLRQAFDIGDLSDDPDSRTQLQSSPPSDLGSGPSTAPTAAPPSDFGSNDDDLNIGEVSRVVNLADLARTPSRRASTISGTGAASTRTTGIQPALRATGAQPSLRATGAHSALRATGAQTALRGDPSTGASSASGPAFRATGAQSAFRATGAQPSLDDLPLDPNAPSPNSVDGALLAAPPDGIAPVATSHRRGLIVLLGAAATLVIAVIIALTVTSSGDDTAATDRLRPVNDFDTSRPDDPSAHRPLPGQTGSGSAVATPHPNPGDLNRPHRPTAAPPPTPHEPETPPVDALRGDEIEAVARKYQDLTQRCYMRSQRGTDAILVGDVKKIAVTLQIEKDGSVTDVQLSDHAADTLGKCLSAAIRGWKFRASGGGRFKFSLNFISS